MCPTDVTGRVLLHGPQAVSAARSLAAQRRKDQNWPYPWDSPPPGSEQVQAFGSLVIPAPNTPTLVMSYTVDDGSEFVPTDILFGVVGTTWAPGDFTWSLTVNSPVGVTAVQALPFFGFQSVPTPLPPGPASFPWPIRRGEQSILHSRDTARIVVTNVNLGLGAGSFFAYLLGYTYPTVQNV